MSIKVSDLVEPKPDYLGQHGEVEAIIRRPNGERWLFINGAMLPAFKYRKMQLVEPMSAAEIMERAGQPNLLAGRQLRLRVNHV